MVLMHLHLETVVQSQKRTVIIPSIGKKSNWTVETSANNMLAIQVVEHFESQLKSQITYFPYRWFLRHLQLETVVQYQRIVIISLYSFFIV